MVTLDTKLFSYHDKVYVTELSTLTCHGIESMTDLVRRVWKGSDDQGFQLRGDFGTIHLYVLKRTEKNPEDGVTAWHFVPADPMLVQQGMRLVIFND